MTPEAFGAATAYRTLRDAIAPHLAEAERAASLPDLDADNAAFCAAKHDTAQRVARFLDQRITELEGKR